MKTKAVTTLLLSVTVGAGLIYGVYRLSQPGNETSPTPPSVSSNAAAASNGSASSPLEAVAGSPAVARSQDNNSGNAATSAPRPERNSVDQALSEIESRLATSTGGGQTSQIRREDVRFTHPTKLEKEDNVSVGVVFSVGDDGLDVEGNGIKTVFKKIFDE
ncbi:MAG: hypothetical protein AAF585_21745, partial [Verrucomicrobiota bacterium]